MCVREKKYLQQKLYKKLNIHLIPHTFISVNLFVFRIIKDKQATVCDRMHYVYVVKLLKSKKLLIT